MFIKVLWFHESSILWKISGSTPGKEDVGDIKSSMLTDKACGPKSILTKILNECKNELVIHSVI